MPQEAVQKEHLQVPDLHQNRRTSHRQSVLSQDIDLSDTVANFVDFVKEGRHTRHRYRHNLHTRYRGWLDLVLFMQKFFVSKMNSSFEGSWSTSSSPVRSPSPSLQGRDSNAGLNGQYGTTSLQQRSRSPSPSHAKINHFKGKIEFIELEIDGI